MQTDRIGCRALRLALGIACLGALSGAVGCSAARYLYNPEENATARVAGKPAAYYQIPAQSPHGGVRVAVLGISKLEPQGRSEAWDESSEGHIRAMHVRLIVDNNDDTAPWQVDTRQQIGSLDNHGQSRPAFATLGAGHPPIAAIDPGTSETLDLYYPLPASMQKASEIPHFEVLWRVQTAEALVSERTTFERLQIEAPQTQGYYACMGPTSYGWYDPFWPNYAFGGAPPVIMYSAPPAYGPPVVRTRR
jgi:hypothetical protein